MKETPSLMPNTLKWRLAVIRLIAGLVVALLGAVPVWAGELDGDFAGPKGQSLKAGEKIRPAPAEPTDRGKSDLAKGSELDDESPAQAYRGGGGRGWGGRGWGGGGRGWGGGYGRGWGGWGRGWGGWGRGWYGGWGRGWYGGWGWGWPYYAGLWRPYWGYGYGSYFDPYYAYGW
jgi:hypothetical protein